MMQKLYLLFYNIFSKDSKASVLFMYKLQQQGSDFAPTKFITVERKSRC